jgi:Helicase conserved C-terminal domain
MEYELIDETEDDVEENEETVRDSINIEKLKEEIQEISKYLTWARSIRIDSKSRALLKALETGFAEMSKMGANRKALIFTESRRTQEYLKDFLESNGYAGKVVLFNGTNSDEQSKVIYERWLEKYQHTSRVSGSKSADMRAALVEHFRDNAEIMIATESAAEGVNLQFCSLVIIYDLPWNPQRIEQRIGRCHRYGQKHDVVVINFINERNEADRRVYELLKEKFNLFTGILGASDDVLGRIESGVDFEKRILAIYQQCRTPEEIEEAFKQLQQELEEQIQSRMDDTRKVLLEHFDEDVHARLKVHLEDTKYQLDRVSRMFWTLTKVILAEDAKFNDNDLSFTLNKELPVGNIQKGQYELISKDRKETNAYLYRLSHPLGEHVIQLGKTVPTPIKEVHFNITNHPVRISIVENLKGKSGYLTLTKLTIDSYEKEEYLLFNGITDDGQRLDQEICEKLFQCVGEVKEVNEWSNDKHELLLKDAKRHVEATISQSLENNNKYFQEERERLEKWADDLILAAEKELNDTKAKIKEAKRQARLATSTEEQYEIQNKIKELERQQRRQRQRIFEVEDEIMEKRDQLIDELEKRMVQKTEQEELFTIRWKVV